MDCAKMTVKYAQSRMFNMKSRFGLAMPFMLICMSAIGSYSAPGQVNVTTYHNDIGRTGQNTNETILNTTNVTPSLFGRLFLQPVDGQVYAQPLYLAGLTVNGATHNVIFVATENDSVYAFDADSNGGTNATPLWQASLLSPAHGAASGATTIPSSDIGSDISPQVGITGTPVIDPATGTLYVVSAALENGASVQRLHALNVATGAEKFGGPVVITATISGTGSGSVNGTVTFDSLWENQRPGLLLLNGIVYLGFASHGDNGPWHGWILGYNAATLQQTGAYCASPNGTGSGFWSSGDGLPADQLDTLNHPYGRMFVPTGNGDYNATKPYTNSMDYGDSELNLDLTNGVPTVTDEFTTNQQASLNSEDGDVGSGGLIVLPTQTGTYPHLAVQSGKGGSLYLLNRDNLGGYNTATDQVVQELSYAVGDVGVWSTPAYWNGAVYYWGRFDYLKAFPLVGGVLSATPTKSIEQYGFPGATPSISANGSTQGIVWTIDSEQYYIPGPAVLQAHSASNVATMLYSSATNASRDMAGAAVKFAVPTIANGKVYVGTANQIDIYGLLNGATQTQTPTIAPSSETFTGTVSVTITDATPNASIFYTTNGSAATTSSTLYTGPISVSSTETINAIASSSSQLLSAQTSATYTDITQAAAVTFSLPTGTYASAQTVTLSDSTPNATIYYTTDGSTPTTASTVYSKAITVSSTETISAIAVASGLMASAALSSTYTIQTGQTGIAFGEGFAGSTGLMVLNGSAALNDSRLQLTDGNASEAGSGWYHTPVNIQSFTTNFTFQLSNPNANGMTFAIQNSAKNVNALGGNAYELGYAPLTNSLAIKFDLYNSGGEGTDSTGLYLNGAIPTVPAIDLTASGINLHSGNTMSVSLVYNGTTLNMTVTDIVTAAVWSTSWTVNIPSTIGGNTAYVGFTGSTGSQTASQKILSWSFINGTGTVAAATPTFTPGTGNYSGAQSVTISDATVGATIYYTINGSAPTSASAVYTGPISITSTETVQAIAIASGDSNSAVGSATYTFSYPAPFGNLEEAVDGTTLETSIPTADTLFFGGWVADQTDGSPLTNVKVFVDGVLTGIPILGISRPDVATYFANPAYSKSGFIFNYGAASLTLGTHSVTVVAVNSHSVSTTLGPRTFTIVKPNPVGNFELAGDSVTGASTISRSKGTLFVGGWAADYHDDGPAKTVQVLIDGNPFGFATLGISRPDVAAYYNNPAWTNTGYQLASPVSSLSLGSHTITVIATDAEGLSTTLGQVTITITP